jgi:hypothetical protein
VRVYFDTGVFIDYLSAFGNMNAILRSSGRRGRTPAAIALDAERLFERVGRVHAGATSCLTYYEVEEALYRLLAQSAKGAPRADTFLIPAARSSKSIYKRAEFGPPMRSTQLAQLRSMPIFWFQPMRRCCNWIRCS